MTKLNDYSDAAGEALWENSGAFDELKGKPDHSLSNPLAPAPRVPHDKSTCLAWAKQTVNN